MKPLLITLLLMIGLSSAMSEHYCDDCGMANCLYEAIDKRYDESHDNNLMESIYFVCGQRGIADYKTIDIIKANYGL